MGLSFYICDLLLRRQDICDLHSNSGRHNICNFGLFVSLLILSRINLHVFLCIGYSLMSFSRLDTRVFGMVLFLFLRSYVFCWICLTTFSTSKFFPFISLSRNFLSVIDVINFDKSNSMLSSGNSHSFSNSSNFSQWSSGVSLSVCFAQKNLLLSCICFFSMSSICYIVLLVCLF